MVLLTARSQVMRLLPAWALLVAWFFFGGLALAEHTGSAVESSEQETQTCEHTLSLLEQALQPTSQETSPDDHPLTFAGAGDLPALSAFLVVRLHRPYARSSPLLLPSSLDRYQLLSTYRI